MVVEKLKEMRGEGGVGCCGGGVGEEKMVVVVVNLKNKKKVVVVLRRKEMEAVVGVLIGVGDRKRWPELGWGSLQAMVAGAPEWGPIWASVK